MPLNKTILFVGGNLYPYKIGGYEVFNYHLIQELRSFYAVKYISTYPKPDYLDEHEYSRTLNLKPEAVFNPLLFSLKILREWRTNKNLIVILTYARSRWINWWIYPTLKLTLGLKYIIVIHGGKLNRWDWNLPHKWFFKNSNKAIGISSRICEEYFNRTGVKILHIPPLIPFTKYCKSKRNARKNWTIPEDSVVFLFVGSLKPLKNPIVLINAILSLGKEYIKKEKLKFYIAGDGPLRESLLLKVNMQDLQDSVIFLGNVKREHLPSLYAASDSYVITSEYEGTPLSLLEAMFNKLYILASDAPGINAIISDGINGRLFPTHDSNILAKSISYMLKYEDYGMITQNAYSQYIQQFEFDKMLKKYQSLFDAI